MTDKEIQDLISLKKYEQPEDGYFDDFLVEFQQRQRSEMLKTSARGLLMERTKAWFTEFGAMRWVMGAGAAYAAVAVAINVIPNQGGGDGILANEKSEGALENIVSAVGVDAIDATVEAMPVSMVFMEPVDFSGPSPVFSADEKIF